MRKALHSSAYGKERTIVSRRGKDLAAVIPLEDFRLLERLAQEEMDRIDIEAADEFRAAVLGRGAGNPGAAAARNA